MMMCWTSVSKLVCVVAACTALSAFAHPKAPTAPPRRVQAELLPVCDGGWTDVPNYNRRGSYWYGHSIKEDVSGQSLTACADRCNSDPQCVAFTRHIAGRCMTYTSSGLAGRHTFGSDTSYAKCGVPTTTSETTTSITYTTTTTTNSPVLYSCKKGFDQFLDTCVGGSMVGGWASHDLPKHGRDIVGICRLSKPCGQALQSAQQMCPSAVSLEHIAPQATTSSRIPEATTATMTHITEMTVVGRYILIAVVRNILNLAEVQAFDSNGNLIQASSASMSSTTGNSEWGPNKCINTHTTDLCHTVSSSSRGNQWLLVDYGEAIPIGRIVVTNRIDCCRDRIIGAMIAITVDSSGTHKVWSSTFTGDSVSYSFEPRASTAMQMYAIPTVMNAGFEEGSTTSSYQYTHVPNWASTGHVLFIRSGHSAWGSTHAAEGWYFLGVQKQWSKITQSVMKHIVNKTYDLKFFVAKRPGGDPTLEVKLAGQSMLTAVISGTSFSTTVISYTASSEIVDIQFENVWPQYPADTTIFLDNISISEAKADLTTMAPNAHATSTSPDVTTGSLAEEVRLTTTVRDYLTRLTDHCPPERCIRIARDTAARKKVVLCGGGQP